MFAERIGELNERVAPSAAVYSIQEVTCIFFRIFANQDIVLNILFIKLSHLYYFNVIDEYKIFSQ